MTVTAPTAERSVRRLVCLHGFSQTHHHWHRVGHEILDGITTPSQQPSLAMVDLPGHGLSGDDHTGIASSGDLLAELGGPGTWIGYSMGGRFALHAALSPLSRIGNLILIGATPGIDNAANRAERADLDDQRAVDIERRGVDPFLVDWLAAPMFAGLPLADRRPGSPSFDQRRRNTVSGLAASLRTSGTGRQRSLWADLEQIQIPVLVLAGERDEKFTAVGRQMADRLPAGEFIGIRDAGHAAHTERPSQVVIAITTWLRSIG